MPVVSITILSKSTRGSARPTLRRKSRLSPSIRSPWAAQQMQPFGELQHVLAGAGDEVAVDADLAELVDDDGDPAGVGRAQQAIDQRGLAGAEEAG